ncbi:hypothetical protein GCM10022419_063650 [Nonomuraea rosea]|uniref:1,3-beta-glucanase n=1 Tax=Nonomuraea rosea TaxID=638574 RepID=A0ABP6XYG2_9ACTN
MPIFSSQFDRARELSQTYAGEASERRFWIPAAVAVAGAAGVTALAAAGDAEAATEPVTEASEWGAGWDEGWGTGPAADDDSQAAPGGDDGGAWSYHSDYTGASVGGDGDFFYFVDGDTSYTIG